MEDPWRHLGKDKSEAPGARPRALAEEDEVDKDFYAFLNVSPDCSLDEIKTAYKRLALIWHPDRHNDEVSRAHATAKFARLTYINEILMDPAKRQVRPPPSSPPPLNSGIVQHTVCSGSRGRAGGAAGESL